MKQKSKSLENLNKKINEVTGTLYSSDSENYSTSSLKDVFLNVEMAYAEFEKIDQQKYNEIALKIMQYSEENA